MLERLRAADRYGMTAPARGRSQSSVSYSPAGSFSLLGISPSASWVRRTRYRAAVAQDDPGWRASRRTSMCVPDQILPTRFAPFGGRERTPTRRNHFSRPGESLGRITNGLELVAMFERDGSESAERWRK
jgi:hypothetical protein